MSYLIRVLHSHWTLQQRFFRTMKSFCLLRALQTFEVVSDPLWKYAEVIYRTDKQNSAEDILQKIRIGYLIGRRQLLPGTPSSHGNWSHFRFSPGPVLPIQPTVSTSIQPRASTTDSAHSQYLDSAQGQYYRFSPQWTQWILTNDNLFSLLIILYKTVPNQSVKYGCLPSFGIS